MGEGWRGSTSIFSIFSNFYQPYPRLVDPCKLPFLKLNTDPFLLCTPSTYLLRKTQYRPLPIVYSLNLPFKKNSIPTPPPPPPLLCTPSTYLLRKTHYRPLPIVYSLDLPFKKNSIPTPPYCVLPRLTF